MSDLSLSPPATQPGLTRLGRRRRLPSPRAVRRRFRLAQLTLVAIGALLAAVVAQAALAAITARGLSPDLLTYGLALLLLAVGAGLPWLLVEVLWRWTRRRHGWDV